MKLAAAATAGTAANTQTYTYPGTSHRLQNVTGQSTKQFTYDATGNTLTETGANNFTCTFDAKNRMRTVRVGATAADTVTYSINALGQRVRKLGAGAQATAADQTSKTARFVYDEQGRLVGEYDNAGKLIQETVWMNDLPIATLRPKGANATLPLGTAGTGAATANNLGTNTAANKVNVDFFYVHPDHLGTPRTVSKPADNKRVWEWNSTPFGETAPNENPQNVTGAANQFRYNLRFPGQFFDAETGKHYNYFRDYDASLGRYVESDPIGLRGGVNTFGYVRAHPLGLSDPTGLAPGGQLPPPASDTSPCNYYSLICQQTGCRYYCLTAPLMCNFGATLPPFLWGAGTSQMNCVRKCLVREDARKRKKVSETECRSGPCLGDREIDDYHDTCYTECGMDTNLYPGVQPRWLPVPTNPPIRHH